MTTRRKRQLSFARTVTKLAACSLIVFVGMSVAQGPIYPVLGFPIVGIGVLAALIF